MLKSSSSSWGSLTYLLWYCNIPRLRVQCGERRRKAWTIYWESPMRQTLHRASYSLPVFTSEAGPDESSLLVCNAGWVSRGRLWFIVTKESAGPVCLAVIWRPFVIRLLLNEMFFIVLPFPRLKCKMRLKLEMILKNNSHEGTHS